MSRKYSDLKSIFSIDDVWFLTVSTWTSASSASVSDSEVFVFDLLRSGDRLLLLLLVLLGVGGNALKASAFSMNLDLADLALSFSLASSPLASSCRCLRELRELERTWAESEPSFESPLTLCRLCATLWFSAFSSLCFKKPDCDLVWWPASDPGLFSASFVFGCSASTSSSTLIKMGNLTQLFWLAINFESFLKIRFGVCQAYIR